MDIINNPIPLTPQDIEMVPNMRKTRTVQPKLPDYADYVGLRDAAGTFFMALSRVVGAGKVRL